MKKNAPIKAYRMVAMIFGITSSPFLTQFVKNLFANYAEAANSILNVVDYLESTDTVKEAVKLDVIHVNLQGGFEIRNFMSNSKHVLRGIKEDLLAKKTRYRNNYEFARRKNPWHDLELFRKLQI